MTGSLHDLIRKCFAGAKNIGFGFCLKFFCQEKAGISFFMVAILKGKNGGHFGIGANVNIDFQIPDGISFSKIYSFANLERKYIVTLNLCLISFL